MSNRTTPKPSFIAGLAIGLCSIGLLVAAAYLMGYKDGERSQKPQKQVAQNNDKIVQPKAENPPAQTLPKSTPAKETSKPLDGELPKAGQWYQNRDNTPVWPLGWEMEFKEVAMRMQVYVALRSCLQPVWPILENGYAFYREYQLRNQTPIARVFSLMLMPTFNDVLLGVVNDVFDVLEKAKKK